MDFSNFTTLTFDCYGTLINWEAGILPALHGILRNHDCDLADDELLRFYGEFEAAAERGTYQSYRKVLESVVRQLAARLKFEPTGQELRSLADSVPTWPPFADTVTALQRLQSRFRLAIISNIDNEMFAETRKLLHADFSVVITAEKAQSYKPSANNFRLALQELGISTGHLLHVGQSKYHDVIPAQSLGIKAVWVNRNSARPNIGAVITADAEPDLEVPDLATLAALAVPN